PSRLSRGEVLAHVEVASANLRGRLAMRWTGHRATGNATPQTEGKAIRWARLYDLGTTFLSFGRAAALRRRTVELAEIAPSERVLDVGCGPGRLAIAAALVAGAAGETRGIDPAPEMVELARRKALRAGVRVQFDV